MPAQTSTSPPGAYGDSGAYAGFQARAYSDRDAVTDGHANPGPGPNRNADTHTRAHGDPDGNSATYARTNGERTGNTYTGTSPEFSHVAGTRCSARGAVLALRRGANTATRRQSNHSIVDAQGGIYGPYTGTWFAHHQGNGHRAYRRPLRGPRQRPMRRRPSYTGRSSHPTS